MRLLFVNIIVQAVKDAFLRVYETKSAEGTNKCARNKAIHWLTEDNTGDFHWVCDFASVSADRIRRISKELMKMPERERVAKVRKMIANSKKLYVNFPVNKM